MNSFKKTGNTPYEFIKFDIDLDNNLYIPKISSLNALRRDVLKKLEDSAIKHSIRVSEELKLKNVQKEVSNFKA